MGDNEGVLGFRVQGLGFQASRHFSVRPLRRGPCSSANIVDKVALPCGWSGRSPKKRIGPLLIRPPKP